MYCANLICMSSLYFIPLIHLLQTPYNKHALSFSLYRSSAHRAQYALNGVGLFSLLIPRFIHFDFVEKNLFSLSLLLNQNWIKAHFCNRFLCFFFFFSSLICVVFFSFAFVLLLFCTALRKRAKKRTLFELFQSARCTFFFLSCISLNRLKFILYYNFTYLKQYRDWSLWLSSLYKKWLRFSRARGPILFDKKWL